MLNSLDQTLQQVCPTVMVPRFSEFAPLTGIGHRFLAASDGLYLELVRPWLYAVMPIGETAIPLPYGPVNPCVRFRLSGLAPMVAKFVSAALEYHPQEHAAWFSADGESGTLSYLDAEVISRGTGHIRYSRPRPAPGTHLAIDIHSHGKYPAGFSSRDDRDSEDDAKLEIVVGNLDLCRPSVSCRLSMLGIQIDYTAWLSNLLREHGIDIGVPA